MQSLEQGQIVPATGSPVYTNAGQALAPFTSDQFEVGSKATMGGMLLTTALFQINRALQYAVQDTPTTSTYVQDGREVHRGFEFTASGKPAADWTLYGGLTLMHAAVEKKASQPQSEGKVPTNVAQQLAKVYAEYTIPALRRLVLTGGVYYTGKMYADVMNTDRLPAVTTEDLGARFTTDLASHPLILRLDVTNLADKNYWLDSSYTGSPRQVAFSAQLRF